MKNTTAIEITPQLKQEVEKLAGELCDVVTTRYKEKTTAKEIMETTGIIFSAFEVAKGAFESSLKESFDIEYVGVMTIPKEEKENGH